MELQDIKGVLLFTMVPSPEGEAGREASLGNEPCIPKEALIAKVHEVISPQYIKNIVISRNETEPASFSVAVVI
ncbi:MAG TPA: hypothetical protein GX509_00780 [Firmicutes bacterium]|nr:hypothetical protein [Bacillota bacterium]HHY97250.1 hypothetical protein [Bacillota bacterium]